MTDLIALFKQNLVVLAQGYTEYDRSNVLKAVNPLFPFTPLATNIEHAASDQFMDQSSLTNHALLDA